MNISLHSNLSKNFPQIGSENTGHCSVFVCFLFLWMGTVLLSFHSEGKTPVSMHCLNIISRGLQMEEPHIYNMWMLMLSWSWALFVSKIWILAILSWEKILKKINDCLSNNKDAKRVCCYCLLRSINLQNMH